MPIFVEYRDIPGFPRFQAGTDGGIRRRVTNNFWRHLSHNINQQGYATVNLPKPKGGQTTQCVHTLVLITFVGPKPEGMQCCHGNGIRFDCRLENLRWDTQAANEADKIIHGTHRKGCKLRIRFLTPADVVSARRMIQEGASISYVAKLLDVSESTVTRIRDRTTWKWVK